jgi:hypothetical protein
VISPHPLVILVTWPAQCRGLIFFLYKKYQEKAKI